VIVLFAWNFDDHLYWATAVFVVAMATDQVDGWLARRRNQTSAFGSLLDPIADKVLVLAALVMLVAEGVAPAWMVAAIVAREIAVSGLRLAAIERVDETCSEPGRCLRHRLGREVDRAGHGLPLGRGCFGDELNDHAGHPIRVRAGAGARPSP
jgi:phosphatidylglycerophosphate synthase